jgi:hypothetical protein
MQPAVTTPARTRGAGRKQARHSRAAAAVLPAMPEARHAGRGLSLFTYPNATRTIRAGLRFDTGHSF